MRVIYSLKINAVKERRMAMRRLFLAGIVWIVLTGTCPAAEPGSRINSYDPGKLHELADQIASEAGTSIKKAFTPSEVDQILEQAQMDFLRILIRQNDEIIRQNNEIIRLIPKIPKQ